METSNTIQLKLQNGFQVNALEKDYISDEIRKNGTYEKTLNLFIEQILGEHRIYNCIDVGANIGVVTLTMAKGANRVVSFEPIPQLYDLLKKSLNDNYIQNCQVENTGLSDKNTQSTLYLDTQGNIGASTLKPITQSHHQQSLNIKLEKGDDNEAIKNLGKSDLIKIDVEGHEAQVLLGLANHIKTNRPLIIIEWNNDHTRNAFFEHKLIDNILKDYRIYELTSRYRAFKRTLDIKQTPKLEKALKKLTYKLTHTKATKEAPVLFTGFDPEEEYQSIALVPKPAKIMLKNAEVIDWEFKSSKLS